MPFTTNVCLEITLLKLTWVEYGDVFRKTIYLVELLQDEGMLYIRKPKGDLPRI